MVGNIYIYMYIYSPPCFHFLPLGVIPNQRGCMDVEDQNKPRYGSFFLLVVFSQRAGGFFTVGKAVMDRPSARNGWNSFRFGQVLVDTLNNDWYICVGSKSTVGLYEQSFCKWRFVIWGRFVWQGGMQAGMCSAPFNLATYYSLIVRSWWLQLFLQPCVLLY